MIFYSWCPNKRDKCYLAISRDLSARPHEILELKIKDIVFKLAGNKQYAEVLVNGKTGTRHLPLIDSLPYVKDWLDHHPQRNNKNAYFICSMFRCNVGGRMTRIGLLHLFTQQYREYFSKLASDPTVPKDDQQRIKELLRKPWNLYIRRHSALTQKSSILKEHILRQHAGWSARSQMHLKYLHYYGNESSTSLLQEYGILPKDSKDTDVLRPKYCPHCQEANTQNQKFCTKCRMVLTYDAYDETLESEKQKNSKLEGIENRLNTMQSMMEKLVLTITKTADQECQTELVKSMYESGLLKVTKCVDGLK